MASTTTNLLAHLRPKGTSFFLWRHGRVRHPASPKNKILCLLFISQLPTAWALFRVRALSMKRNRRQKKKKKKNQTASMEMFVVLFYRPSSSTEGKVLKKKEIIII